MSKKDKAKAKKSDEKKKGKKGKKAKVYAFSHHEGSAHEFVPRGLRSYFEYRDLGIDAASRGDFVAHVIRAKEGDNAKGQWHVHDCAFQMYYVIKGEARFEYEGSGIHTVRAGDCVMQPPNIRHREIEHSADYEVIEIVAPADFASYDVEGPESDAEAAD